nr:MAG TPA: hypothetical protein [Caudoviricetes sp.]
MVCRCRTMPASLNQHVVHSSSSQQFSVKRLN